MYDGKNKRGFIYNKIHYLKYKKPAKRHAKAKNCIVVENETDDCDVESNDDIDELNFLLFFKTCIVDKDLPILKIKLEQSIPMREKLIKKANTEFHKVFPFYFIEPKLVSNYQYSQNSFFSIL